MTGFPDGTFTESPTSGVDRFTIVPNDSDPLENIEAATPWGAVFGATAAGNGIYSRIYPASGFETIDFDITFATPASPGGWGLAVSDVEEEQVILSVPGATGDQIAGSVPAGSVGFNAQPSSYADTPTWTAASSTLTGGDPAGGTNEAGWFMPSVTAPSVRLAICGYDVAPEVPCVEGAGWGSHSFRLFMAVLAEKVSGTATRSDSGAGLAGVTVTLKNAAGTAVGTATTDASGAYSFPRVYAIGGYSASASTPSGLEATSPASVSIDLSKGPGTANFTYAAATPATAPDITTRRAVVTGASNLVAWNRVTTAGTVRVTGRIGGVVACTGSSKAKAAGLVRTTCRLNARARAIIAGRTTTRVRVTSVLTATDGKKATDVTTATVRRRVVAVTG